MKETKDTNKQTPTITPERLHQELLECLEAKRRLFDLYMELVRNQWSEEITTLGYLEQDKLRAEFDSLSAYQKADRIRKIIEENSSKNILCQIETARYRLQQEKKEQEQLFAEREKQLLEVAAKLKQYETDMTAKLLKDFNNTN